MFRKSFHLMFSIFFLIAILAACSKPTKSVTLPPLPTQTLAPTSTHTLAPTSTHTLAPTSTHTPTPTSTHTPTPTSTRTLTPTSTRTLKPASTRTQTARASSTSTWTETPVEGSLVVKCPGAPDITLKIGDWAQVSIDPPLPNKVRSQPGNSGEIIGKIQPGEKVLVVDGPHCADGYTWWFVRSLDGLEGWTAEGDTAGYWLIPLQPVSVGLGWQSQTPANAPSPRKGIGMVYDSRRKVVVAVGGTDWITVSDETWEFDGITWHLREDVNRIPERSGAAMAYDTDRQVTVLFGGSTLGDNKFYNDTWEYDGKNWVQQDPSQSPPARNGAAMAYDPKSQRMLLFGGYGRFGNPAFFDDTWEYVDGEWQQLAPAQHPSAREATHMVYDIARGRLVLFGGGHNAGSVVFNDTWEWKGQNWLLRTDLPASPSARWAFFMIYDQECQRVVLFGGLTGTINQFNDTWTYDGKNWEQVSSDQQPPARWDGGMVYDFRNHRSVLFGGQYWKDKFSFLGDTWYFTGKCK